jgi:hypothetical protein
MTTVKLPQAGFPPGVYLIGAQKAGTTSLADALSMHRDVELSRPKEPHFFTRHWERRLDWYRKCFSGDWNKILIDASTSYSMAPTSDAPESRFNDVPRRILQLRPDARFLYVVRDPVERAISSYWHAVRNGDEHRPIERCMTEESTYIRASRYAFQLERYFEHFPRERFLILTSRELATDMDDVTRRCWDFLGLDGSASTQILSSVRRNESYVPRGALGALLCLPGGKAAAGRTWAVLRATLPKGALHRIKRSVSARPPAVSEAVRETLAVLLAGERRRLQALVGIEIS